MPELGTDGTQSPRLQITITTKIKTLTRPCAHAISSVDFIIPYTDVKTMIESIFRITNNRFGSL